MAFIGDGARLRQPRDRTLGAGIPGSCWRRAEARNVEYRTRRAVRALSDEKGSIGDDGHWMRYPVDAGTFTVPRNWASITSCATSKIERYSAATRALRTS